MPLFAATNLLKTSVAEVIPWEFTPETPVPEKARKDKAARQAWYVNPSTTHQFYCGVEAANPNVRVGKDNPPHRLHAIAADYDLPIPDATVRSVLASWRIKPSYLEHTLGGNWRPVWLLATPLPVGSMEFYGFLMDKVQKWLGLDALPGLDVPALTAATRLFCNGCHWEDLKNPAIPEVESQTLLVDAVREFNFKGCGDELDIPFDVLEKAMREKFPGYDWPTDFTLDSQGPSFFVEGSQSAKSAIIKKGGIFTFSAHAFKSFYTWTDLLGGDFVRDFRTNSLGSATQDTWYDGKSYWRKDPTRGSYMSETPVTLALAWKVQHRIVAKANPKTGLSPLDEALHHVNSVNRIDGAAPLVFRPSGVVDFAGRRVLNTYVNRVMKPASGSQSWGPKGNFPELAKWMDNFFDPPEQLTHFLAWFQHFYSAGLDEQPRQGQSIFLPGPTGLGKTCMNVGVIGAAVGGHVDASDYLLKGGAFNSQMFNAPLWCVDDESASSGDERNRNYFAAALKKLTANTSHLYHQKFQVPVTTEWMGRAVITTNTDFGSTRVIMATDDNSDDKINLYRCVPERRIILPPKHVFEKTLARELPFFLRWLIDWTVPDSVKRNGRYGFASYQNELMLERVNQTSRAAPLVEVVQQFLKFWFSNNQKADCWRGSVTQLFTTMHLDPTFQPVVGRYTIEQMNRYLEAALKSHLLPCTTETCEETKSRLWVFPRP